MKTETAYMQRVQRELSNMRVTTFRNNCGVVKVTDCRCPVKRVVRYGIANPGGSDLIGWQSVEITPEMAGSKIAVFTAIETKVGINRLTPEQANFLEQVRIAGGVGVESRDIQKVREAIWHV